MLLVKEHQPPRTNSEKSVMGFAVVPYIQGITEPIKRILGSFNIKVAQKPFLMLGHIFAKPKDHIAKEQRKDAVYSIRWHAMTVIRNKVNIWHLHSVNR